MDTQHDPRVVRSIYLFSIVAGVLTCSIVLVEFLSWAFRIRSITSALFGLTAMKPITALVLFLYGLSLLLLHKKDASLPGKQHLGQFARTMVAIGAFFALISLCDIVFGWNIGIGEMLFAETTNANSIPRGPEMAFLTSLACVLLGVALLTVDTETKRGYRPAEIFALAALLVCSVPLLAYAYRIPLYRRVTDIAMALPTALSGTLLSFGILCARPEQGFTSVLLTKTSGAVMARWILAATAFVSLVLGGLRLAAERLQLYDVEFRLALFAVMNMALLAVAVWLAARLVHTTEAGKRVAEKELWENQQRQLLIVEQMPAVLWTTDTELIFTSSVGAALKDLNLLPGEMVHTNLFEYFHTDDPEFPPIRAHRLALQGKAGSYEFAWDERNYEVHIEPLRDREGSITGVIGIALDITERKSAEEALRTSEERYRTFISQNWAGIYRLEVHPPIATDLPPEEQARWILERSFVAECNSAFAQVYGWDSPSDVVGRRLNDLVRSNSAVFLEMLRDFVDHEYRLVDKQVLLQDRNGRQRLVQNSAVGAIKKGQFIHAWGVQRDITESVEMQERLRQLEKMEAVGQLAGGVAHDFNNILGIIIGYVGMMLGEHNVDEATRSRLLMIDKAAARAANLTRQLLAFSRRQVLQPRVFNLNGAVADVQKMLSRLIGEHIQLEIKLSPSLPNVKLDPSQIEQVLMNLAVNARDAMPDGGRLMIETADVHLDPPYADVHPGIRPGHYVLLSVSDTGCGMESDVLAHAFEPFFTTKQKGKGTGLGLSTVYGIVQQSSGSIDVSSELGKGTRFDLYFPVAMEPESISSSDTVPEAPRGIETILLAEDEVDLRGLIRQLLEEGGYKILEAANSQHAVELARTHQGPIHLLVTDVIMPMMSGRQLSEAISAIRPETRTLYVTGYTNDMVAAQGVLEPGISLLQKPFTREDFLRKVHETLKARPRHHAAG